MKYENDISDIVIAGVKCQNVENLSTLLSLGRNKKDYVHNTKTNTVSVNTKSEGLGLSSLKTISFFNSSKQKLYKRKISNLDKVLVDTILFDNIKN